MKRPLLILLNDKDHLKERAQDPKPAEKAEKREPEKMQLSAGRGSHGHLTRS